MPRPETAHNILVVEDEWLIACDIEMMIEEQGHKVIGPAQNVAEAQALIKATQIDAAFLDITLGAETSYPVADMLDDLGVPLTFVSAHRKSEIPAPFRDHDLLPKPVTPPQLVAQMSRMLATEP